MKIINPTFEIWTQQPGEEGIYLQIERAGRVCYKSEKNQTIHSARPFCQRMIDNQHYAMLEILMPTPISTTSVRTPRELLRNTVISW